MDAYQNSPAGGTAYDAHAAWYENFVGAPLFTDLIYPAVLQLVGDVRGRQVCDIACGTGAVSRELVRRGARVTAVDLSLPQLHIACEHEAQEPLGVTYVHADAQTLRLVDQAFGVVTCCHGLTDIPDLEATIHTVRRLLRPRGCFVFSIPHPCFQTPHYEWTTLEDGRTGQVLTGYFDEGFWRSANREGIRYRVGAYHRSLSTYLNALTQAGFTLDQLDEPRANGRLAEQNPGYAQLPGVLIARCRRDGARAKSES